MSEQARDAQGRYAAAAGAAEKASAKANKLGTTKRGAATAHVEAAMAQHVAAREGVKAGIPNEKVQAHIDARTQHDTEAYKAQSGLSKWAGSKSSLSAENADLHKQAGKATDKASELGSTLRNSDKDPDHGQRIAAHEKAANLHTAAAEGYRAAGEATLSRMHERRAAFHKEAAEDHRDAASNAGAKKSSEGKTADEHSHLASVHMDLARSANSDTEAKKNSDLSRHHASMARGLGKK